MSFLLILTQRYKLRWFEPPYFASILQIDFFRYILVLFRE